jgi:hypothetical protein
MPHGEVAKYVLGLSGAAAIEWLARHKPAALLTPIQILKIMEGSK